MKSLLQGELLNLPLGPRKNIGTFYLPPMINFGNFESILGIRGPTLAERSEEIQN